MLTGEYLVLSGAKALALPLRCGQAMEIEFVPGNPLTISWSASDPDGVWFEAELIFKPDLTFKSASDPEIAQRLVYLLNAARSLNPGFLSHCGLYSINNEMSFRRNWGWGSSSTLISNLGWWANVDPFKLNSLVSDGSGYDIACARSGTPLFYLLRNGLPEMEEILFNPPFYEQIAFIYLGRKQDTSCEIQHFNPDPQILNAAIEEISEISGQIATASSLSLFNILIDRHESILSRVLGRATVKETLFPGFDGSVKSLGAWGGDFIMASSPHDLAYTRRFFEEKGYPTTFSWKEIIR